LSKKTDELAQHFILPLWNDRKLDLIERYITPHAEIRTTFLTGTGPEALKHSIEQTFIAFPIFKLSLEEIIQQGNRVTFKWSAYAEHKGSILNIKPSGKGMTFHGIAFGELEGDLIARYDSHSDIPQTLYANLEHSGGPLFPPEAVLLDHENYEKELSEVIFAIIKSTDVQLTRREVECLYFWLKGYSIKETARQLGGISSKTIQVFRDKIRKKFNVNSYRTLVDLLQKNGLLSLFL